MNSLPIAIKFILNLIFFVIYAVIAIFLSGFIAKNFLAIDNITYDNANKLGYIAIAISFVVTIIFRKFFYISFKK